MAYPKRIRERALKLSQEGYSAEQIEVILSHEPEWKGYIPTARTIRNWLQQEAEESRELLPEQLKQAINHDNRIFNESDLIMNEQFLIGFLDAIDMAYEFYESELETVREFVFYFTYASNQYVNDSLYDSSSKMYKSLANLCHYLSLNCKSCAESPQPNGTTDKKYVIEPTLEMHLDRRQYEQTHPELVERLKEIKNLTDIERTNYEIYRMQVRDTLFL